MATPSLLVLAQLLLLITLSPRSASSAFKCSSPASRTCRALIDYPSPNSTTLSSIKFLFSIKKLRTLLAANGLPPSTSSNLTISASQTIKIPFPCTCTSNGKGISSRTPIYTVQPDDGLYHIAAEVFSGLVTYQEIGAANNIKNLDLIFVGQKLWIPLPCSCDEVGGVRVVHYGHVVEAGSSLGGIAQEYGTTEETLMSLNGIVNATSLEAGQVLDVPLRACNSFVSTDSVDYPLLVANGTYVFTANNCVRCKCDSSNNWTLQCEPSGLQVQPSSNWSTCPPVQCETESRTLYIGNTSTSGCNSSTCAYAGFYSNSTILTTLVTESTCPATTLSSPSNYASTMSSRWSYLLTSIHLLLLLLLSIYLL